jgi:hypothetical protein
MTCLCDFEDGGCPRLVKLDFFEINEKDIGAQKEVHL